MYVLYTGTQATDVRSASISFGLCSFFFILWESFVSFCRGGTETVIVERSESVYLGWSGMVRVEEEEEEWEE